MKPESPTLHKVNLLSTSTIIIILLVMCMVYFVAKANNLTKLKLTEIISDK